jgi:transposase
LVIFANGITEDLQAVKAALQYESSNWQTEGQVNRLKLIKRMMDGRGKLDLLRHGCCTPREDNDSLEEIYSCVIKFAG